MGSPHVLAQSPTLQSTAVEVNIAAISLDQAIAQFAGLCRTEISYDPKLLENRKSRGLKGTYTFEQGMTILLQDTPFKLIKRADGIWTITTTENQVYYAGQLKTLDVKADSDQISNRSGVAQLPAITVNAEDSYAYTTKNTATATGLNLSVKETPQSVSVITRKQMDDFNVQNLADIIKVTPGLYGKNGGISSIEVTPYARGFSFGHINVDGIPLDITGFNQRNVAVDTVMYEQVDVVRGATGLLEGAGTPSGTINLVRKRPTSRPLLDLTASYGSWNNQQFTIDASQALNAQGNTRGRVVGAWQDSDSFVDVTNTKNGTFYGIVEADLSDQTKIGLGGSIQRTRTNGVFRGLPTFADGRHMNLSRSSYFDTPDSYQDRDNDTVFADIQHRLNNNWKIKASVTHIKGDNDAKYTLNERITDSETTFNQSESGWKYGTEQTIFDLRLNGDFDLFNRQHEFLIGANYRKDNSTSRQTWGGGGRIIDINNYNPYAYRLIGESATVPLLWGRNTKEYGLFAAANLQLLDSLHAVVGGRFSWYQQDTTGWYTGTPTWKRSLDESAEFTPYFGLVYDINQNHSVYGSVTEIFEPQSSIDVNGNTLDPLTGTNYELGIKGEYFDGALNSSLAIFRIKQRNRAVTDEANCPSSGSISCSRAAGEVQSDGVDLQLTGALTPNWQIALSYTYVKAEYKKDSVASNIGQRINTDEPQHLFKIYTNYQLPAPYDKLSLGASLYGQSKMYRSESGYYTAQDKYATVDLSGGYKFNEHLSLQLNLNNLFDKKYYSELGYSWAGYSEIYGAPRNVLATLRYKF
ncbi:TonB-dependent receptor [Acinetobacter qingfengensis]|uniref:TonB-dependent receptor n=1 Tax=Acinetobacter qingfengensis TaxID=1262585 RepID=A0A1E7R317_9GAMM|nr:TonB-dependent receptor [Acinetobacter qingfengensis]